MAMTQIDQEQFNKVIQQHTDVQSFIQQSQAQIRGEVENAASVNNGAMINSLVQAHEDWETKMNDISNNLTHMVESMKQTQSKLAEQDESNIIK